MGRCDRRSATPLAPRHSPPSRPYELSTDPRVIASVSKCSCSCAGSWRREPKASARRVAEGLGDRDFEAETVAVLEGGAPFGFAVGASGVEKGHAQAGFDAILWLPVALGFGRAGEAGGAVQVAVSCADGGHAEESFVDHA